LQTSLVTRPHPPVCAHQQESHHHHTLRTESQYCKGPRAHSLLVSQFPPQKLHPLPFVKPEGSILKIWGDTAKGPSDDVYELCEKLGQGFLASYAPDTVQREEVVEEAPVADDRAPSANLAETDGSSNDSQVLSTSSGWGTDTGWGSENDTEDDVDRFIGHIVAMANAASSERDCPAKERVLKRYLKSNEQEIIEIGKSLQESDKGTKSQEREMEKAMTSFEAATANCTDASIDS